MSDESAPETPQPDPIPDDTSTIHEAMETTDAAPQSQPELGPGDGHSVEPPTDDIPEALLKNSDDDDSSPVLPTALTVAEEVEPIEATVVDPGKPGMPPKKPFSQSMVKTPPPIPKQFENLAATGGAVTAAVLGLMTLVGAWFSGIAAINGVLGIGMGLWGLASRRKRTAQLGILLCVLGIFLAVYRQS